MDSSGLKEDIFYSSSWMQEILEISNIGLWLLEINKNNTDVRLYADDKMLELLGLQKSLSLEDNYKHFAQGVLAEDLEIVQKYIEQMLTTKRLVRFSIAGSIHGGAQFLFAAAASYIKKTIMLIIFAVIIRMPAMLRS